jgi:hypothetical protein
MAGPNFIGGYAGQSPGSLQTDPPSNPTLPGALPTDLAGASPALRGSIAGNLQLFGFSAGVQTPDANSIAATAQTNDVTFFRTGPTSLIGGGLTYDSINGLSDAYGFVGSPLHLVF